MEKSISISSTGEGCKNKETCDYDEAVELTGHGRYNYILLVASCVIISGVSIDMFGFSVVVAAAKCDLQMGMTEAGVLASAPFAGVIFAFPWGYYADTRGRRRALLLSTSVGFLFAVISSLSMSWQFMFVVKVLGCSFSSASFTLLIAMLGECTGSEHRSRYLFIMNSVNLGAEIIYFVLAYLILPLQFSVPVPWLGIVFRPWRLYTLVLALLLGLGACMLLFLHESPKFLANRGDNLEALKVLRKMYEANGGEKGSYTVKYILATDDGVSKDKTSFWESLVKHTVPIFQPPLLWRTLQLFYLIALCCGINNVFVMWFPMMVNIFFNSFNDTTNDKGFCERIFGDNVTAKSTEDIVCNDVISNNTVYSGIVYGLFFCMATLVVAKWASRRRIVLVTVLSVSAISCILVDIKQPVANMIFFTLLQSTAVGIGSVVSYFVDLYPTSYRGLVTSLGMMFARLISLIGVNVVGTVITDYCSVTFYGTSVIAFSGVIASLFLPSDSIANL